MYIGKVFMNGSRIMEVLKLHLVLCDFIYAYYYFADIYIFLSMSSRFMTLIMLVMKESMMTLKYLLVVRIVLDEGLKHLM